MFDLRRSPRRIKTHRFTHRIQCRPRESLPFVSGPAAPGAEFLLDTCAYIDVPRGHTPPAVDALPGLRTTNHLSVCVAELTHGIGRLDPLHPGTEAVTRSITDVVWAVPPHRPEAAATNVVIEAGILAGLVFRLCGLQSGREVAAINDATVYLHALTNGRTMLT